MTRRVEKSSAVYSTRLFGFCVCVVVEIGCAGDRLTGGGNLTDATMEDKPRSRQGFSDRGSRVAGSQC